MGALTWLASNWRLVGIGVLCIALPIGGWYVKGKFERAAQADALELEVAQSKAQLEAERAATQAASAARVQVSADIAKDEGKTHETAQETVRVVTRVIHDKPDCALSDEAATQLNHLRGYDK